LQTTACGLIVSQTYSAQYLSIKLLEFIKPLASQVFQSMPSGLQAGTLTTFTTGATRYSPHYILPSSQEVYWSLITAPSGFRLPWPFNSFRVLPNSTKSWNSL